MRAINIIASILLIVGGLNWGLIALAEFDLVATIAGLDFGETNAFSRLIYGLVGLSALVVAAAVPRIAAAPTRQH